jgi:DNA-binding transcriptional regulator LsrR (DeoR family)
MSNVLAARDAYMTARRQVTEARHALGRAILDARRQGVQQSDIAKQLGLTREQVRRYQAEYEQLACCASAA